MTVDDLIKKLETFPKDMEVYIFDWRQSLNNSDFESSTIGIHKTFEVTPEVLERSDDSNIQCITLVIDNDDYNDEGEFIV